ACLLRGDCGERAGSRAGDGRGCCCTADVRSEGHAWAHRWYRLSGPQPAHLRGRSESVDIGSLWWSSTWAPPPVITWLGSGMVDLVRSESCEEAVLRALFTC